MQHPHNFIRVSALVIGIAGALAMGHAHGAAFQLKENSAKGLGRAFAGSTSAPGDASVVATNPAAMRQLDGRQVQADLSAISFSADFDGSGRYVGPTGPGTGMPISGGNGGDAGMIAPVPAAYFHMPVGESAHFGVSLTAPFGFKTDYDRNWVGRYQAVTTDLKAVDLGLSGSYDINPYLSFGASVFVQHLTIELSNAIDLGTAIYAQGGGAAGFAPGNADGFVTIEGDNNAVGYTIGGLFSPSENTHIALSYRSKVKHKITGGDADFTVPANAAAFLSVFAPGQFVDTKGRAELTLPASATLSVTHKLNDRWMVMGDVSRTAWKPSFDTVTLEFDSAQADSVLEFRYDDTTFASLGTEYRLNETVTLRGGVAYDETPTSNEHRDVRVPDVTRKWLSLGVGWTPSERMEFNVGYTHLFTKDPTIDSVSATGSTLAGSFAVGGDILAASVNYKF